MSLRVLSDHDGKLLIFVNAPVSVIANQIIPSVNDALIAGTSVNDPVTESMRSPAKDSSDSSFPVNCGPDSSSGSEAFENLLSQLRQSENNKPIQHKKCSNSFVVSDYSLSSEPDSSDCPTFYHKIENAYLKDTAG